MMSRFNPDAYQTVLSALLKKCYGLELADLGLDSMEAVERHMEAGLSPREVLMEYADKNDLDRIDITGFFGLSLKVPITLNDEDDMVRVLGL